MQFVAAVGGALVAVAILGRLLWLMRDRGHRRREQAWRRRWAAYRLRLPTALMARWPRNRSITHQPDTTG